MRNLYVADIATTIHKIGEVMTSRKIILESDAVFEFGPQTKKILPGEKPVHCPEDLSDLAKMNISYICNVRTLSQATAELQKRVLEQ